MNVLPFIFTGGTNYQIILVWLVVTQPGGKLNVSIHPIRIALHIASMIIVRQDKPR